MERRFKVRLLASHKKIKNEGAFCTLNVFSATAAAGRSGASAVVSAAAAAKKQKDYNYPAAIIPAAESAITVSAAAEQDNKQDYKPCAIVTSAVVTVKEFTHSIFSFYNDFVSTSYSFIL